MGIGHKTDFAQTVEWTKGYRLSNVGAVPQGGLT